MLVALLAGLLGPSAEARLNPIRYLTDQVIRPEIVLIFDTSGSMDWPAANSSEVGADCSGHDNAIDICGDHLCSGYERTSTCSTDCQIYDENNTNAGSAEKCYFGSTSSPKVSRMYLSRRAMQNVVADFRGVASFGLIKFDQTGFYHYRHADLAKTSRTVGLYLHQWELRSNGSWVGGLGWDTISDRPASSFTRNGVAYTLDGGTGGDSLYRRVADAPTPSRAFKGWDGGCTSSHRCGWGEGDCDSNSECETGLICGENNGADWFDGPEHDWSPYYLGTLDICVPDPSNPASATFEYLRVDWAGFRHHDGAHDWTYMGSYYTYTAHGAGNGGSVGVFNGWSGCSSSSPCPAGTGDCDSNSECQAGLVCNHDSGPEYLSAGAYGLSAADIATLDICDVPGGGQLLDEFKGPEYSDGGGQLWVYNRFGPKSYSDSYGIVGQMSAEVSVPLYEADDTTTQAQFDETLGLVLNRMNLSSSGGLSGTGNTPTCAALQKAKEHILARRDGTGSYSSPDFAGTCRPRFVVVISDGESNPDCSNNGNGGQMQTYVQQLHAIGVKSYAVTIPGVSSSGRAEMDLIADVGDDGLKNNSAQALYSNNEKELVDNIRRVLFDAIKGQYTTTAAGVASSGTTTVVGDLAVIPSTEFPGWYGHLRTVDLTKQEGQEGYERWDAGDVLASSDWKQRRVYTGRADIDSGHAIPLLATDGLGTVNLSGGCTGCGSHGIKDVWPGTLPVDAKIQAMVRWLAGADRPWKLGALIRSVPATIGPPPTKPAWDGHQAFEQMYEQRQRLVYVTSNEGVIHAFDVTTGREMFAFVPPELLSKILALYEQGGQNDNPQLIKYVMTSSPRVGDLKDSTNGWGTYLVQAMGIGSESFLVLDVTNPTTCTDPGNTTTCAVSSPPRVVFSSTQAFPSIDDKLGETWSIPALFWTGGSLAPRMAMGSGYAATTSEGEWYNLFKTIGSSWSTNASDLEHYHHPTGVGQVRPFAVVPNTVAVTERLGSQPVLATYQADPLGRLYRYAAGETSFGRVSKLLDFGDIQPFLFPPAAIRRDEADRATVALTSGAYQEQDIEISLSNLVFGPSGTGFNSTLYIRSEENGTVLSTDVFTCAAGNLCDSSCYNGGTVYPSSCTGPSSRALPVSQPLLLRNEYLGDRTEALFLLYDPPAQACQGANVAVGNSWVARIALHPNGAGQDLVQLKKFEETQASGLVIVGGGQDVAVSVTGRGNSKAGARTLSETPVNPDMGSRPIRLEGWREVR